MKRTDRTVSKTEFIVGYAILFVLLFITGGIFLKQSRFNPSVLTPGELQVKTRAHLSAPTSLQPALLEHVPENMVALSSPESFGPEDLSDKINGKAELYLSAGFVRLASQRFAVEDDPGVWMEAFLYHMESARSAFAVYSLQKRFDSRELDLGDFAYRTENALFFAHGSYYVEMVSSVAQERMAQLMLAFAERFVRNTKVSGGQISELALFPTQNLERDSIALLPSDGFGFQRFDSIFTAHYEIKDAELTAFLSERKTDAEAADLVQAYVDFLSGLGGAELEAAVDIPGLRIVEIMDTFELVFSRGIYLAGVHSAENRQVGEELAQMLSRTLAKTGQ